MEGRGVKEREGWVELAVAMVVGTCRIMATMVLSGPVPHANSLKSCWLYTFLLSVD
jgi:hypothetical protein